jgi:hypothetical protein
MVGGNRNLEGKGPHATVDHVAALLESCNLGRRVRRQHDLLVAGQTVLNHFHSLRQIGGARFHQRHDALHVLGLDRVVAFREKMQLLEHGCVRGGLGKSRRLTREPALRQLHTSRLGNRQAQYRLEEIDLPFNQYADAPQPGGNVVLVRQPQQRHIDIHLASQKHKQPRPVHTRSFAEK